MHVGRSQWSHFHVNILIHVKTGLSLVSRSLKHRKRGTVFESKITSRLEMGIKILTFWMKTLKIVLKAFSSSLVWKKDLF